MKYYRLLDDVNIQGRWHLGDLTQCDAGAALELWRGSSVSDGILAQVEITHPGKALQFCLTSFGVPVAERRLACAIMENASENLQVFGVTVPGYRDFNVLNSVRVLKCLDETRSSFVKWTISDHRPDLAGQYRMVTNLRIDSRQVPPDAHFFRVEGWLTALIVSEKIKSTMESCGCFGAKFQNV
jgi:hypothetical protein